MNRRAVPAVDGNRVFEQDELPNAVHQMFEFVAFLPCDRVEHFVATLIVIVLMLQMLVALEVSHKEENASRQREQW